MNCCSLVSQSHHLTKTRECCVCVPGIRPIDTVNSEQDVRSLSAFKVIKYSYLGALRKNIVEYNILCSASATAGKI